MTNYWSNSLIVTGKTFQTSFKKNPPKTVVVWKRWGTGHKYQGLNLLFAGVKFYLPKK